jgi:GAF domain-containing protein
MEQEFIETSASEAMYMLEKGVSKQKILAHLVGVAEKVAGGNAVSSILVLDKHGLLRNGSSPQLPADYLKAIDGLRPDPKVGTCAAAAATGIMVITPDFRADSKWAELKHLPMALGFTSAWSFPIKNMGGTVLGTFGTYFRECRNPSENEIVSVQKLALAAAEVLDNVVMYDTLAKTQAF